MALENHFHLLRTCRSVFFQTWAARLASSTASDNDQWAGSYALLHPLLRTEAFVSFRVTMRAALESADDSAGLAVAQVVPQMSEVVTSAVRSVAAGAAADMLDMERSLSLQADAIADARAAQVSSAAADVKADHAERIYRLMTMITRLERKVDALSSGRPAPPLMAPATPAARPPLAAGRAAGAPSVGTVGEWQFPVPGIVGSASEGGSGPAAGAPPGGDGAGTGRVSASLERDRESVRALRLQQKLNGVRILDANGECVPLLRLQVGISWKRALDEYAVGLDGRASIHEVERLFGARWRLLCPDADERSRLVHVYSTRSPLYRAFSVEFGRRGAVVGAPQIVSELKTKYQHVRGGSTAVYKQTKADYPKTDGATA